MKKLTGWPLTIVTVVLVFANVAVAALHDVPSIVQAILAGALAAGAVLGVGVERG